MHQVLDASRFAREERHDQIGEKLSSISYSNCHVNQSAPSRQVQVQDAWDAVAPSHKWLYSPSRICQARHRFLGAGKYEAYWAPRCRKRFELFT